MKVFLSYAHADRAFARRLGDELSKAGFDVWSDNELLPGDNWAEETATAVRRAGAFVALISPDAMDSQNVQHEWQFALGREQFKDRLIPIVIKRTPRMPWIFERLQATRASTPEQAASEVAERLGSTRSTRASS